MQKTLLILTLLASSIIACPAYALFGPSSYEECAADAVKGKTRYEIGFQINSCRKKFPKLPSLKYGADKKILCSSSNRIGVELEFDLENHTGKFAKQDVFVHGISDEQIFFQMLTHNKKGDLLITDGELNILTGGLNTSTSVIKSTFPPANTDYYSCVEQKN